MGEALQRVSVRMVRADPSGSQSPCNWVHTIAKWVYEASRSGTIDQQVAMVRFARENMSQWSQVDRALDPYKQSQQVKEAGGIQPAEVAQMYAEAAFLLALSGLTGQQELFDKLQACAL